MSRRASLWVVVMGAAVLLIAVGLRSVWAESPEDLKGKAAPDFTLKTVDDKEVKLSSLKGNVVLLDFWATWCGPCRKSLPHVQKLSEDKEKAKQGLRVLVVNAQEMKDAIKPFLEKNSYTFTVPIDASGSVMGSYHVEAIPTTVIIGRDGVIRTVYVGVEEPAKVDEAIEAALKAK